MNSASNALHDRERERFSTHCSSFEGAEAIHVERPGIFHVRVSHISYDTWGVKATESDSLIPGMHRPRQSPFAIAASWEYSLFPLTTGKHIMFRGVCFLTQGWFASALNSALRQIKGAQR
jgi:hypothetical protein